MVTLGISAYPFVPLLFLIASGFSVCRFFVLMSLIADILDTRGFFLVTVFCSGHPLLLPVDFYEQILLHSLLYILVVTRLEMPAS